VAQVAWQTWARLRAPTEIDELQWYRPLFSPWAGRGEFGQLYDAARPYTLVTPESAWILYSVAGQALALEGEFWEAGVYRGGTARMLRQLVESRGASRRLRLFDSFEGMRVADSSRDFHRSGDFADDASLDVVQRRVGTPDFVSWHPGWIPETFRGLEASKIALAHVDVDLHDSVLACCEFIYPRLVPGGVLLFDDYGYVTCPGARQAVDAYFSDKPESPLVLPTGQALVIRLPH
jgi:O-methyltransferase